MTDQREMFDEIGALIGALAKGFNLGDAEIIQALEQGAVQMALQEDEQGERFIEAVYGEKALRIYQGAIQYAPGQAPDDQPAEAEDEGHCGTGGCGCGH